MAKTVKVKAHKTKKGVMVKEHTRTLKALVKQHNFFIGESKKAYKKQATLDRTGESGYDKYGDWNNASMSSYDSSDYHDLATDHKKTATKIKKDILKYQKKTGVKRIKLADGFQYNHAKKKPLKKATTKKKAKTHSIMTSEEFYNLPAKPYKSKSTKGRMLKKKSDMY